MDLITSINAHTHTSPSLIPSLPFSILLVCVCVGGGVRCHALGGAFMQCVRLRNPTCCQLAIPKFSLSLSL